MQCKIVFAAAAVASSIFISGCSSPWITNTKRSAVEQYIMSTAIERAVNASPLKKCADKKVYMDYSLMVPQDDKAYLQGRIEMALGKQHCILVKKEEAADITVQPLCGVLATDHISFLFGTPSIPIPLPDTNLNFAIPEIPIFKRFRRAAFARLSFNIYDSKTHKLIEAVSHVDATSYYNNFTIILIPFVTHDLNKDDMKTGNMNWELE